MRKIILFITLLLALEVAFCSCQLFAQDETVDFELPTWPEYLPELTGWRVSLRQAQGPHSGTQEPRDSGVVELVETPADKRYISFRLPKNQPVCITATPITQNRFFKPAGTIYPYSQKITWSGGYAAHLYKILPDSEQFNWEKLLETLEQKQNDALSLQDQQEPEPFYNPWLLDSQEILEGITYRSFSATKLKQSQNLCIPLDFEVFSSYVPENEFLHQKNQTCVTVRIGQPELFALGTLDFQYGVIICANSAKNISLDLVSMPIFKEDL